MKSIEKTGSTLSALQQATTKEPKTFDRRNRFGESAARRHEDLRKTVIRQLRELSDKVTKNNRLFHGEGSTDWGFVSDLDRMSGLLDRALSNGEG